jgi:hypothetical protein
MRGMTFDTFRASLVSDAPPAGSSLALQALWWAERGDWDAAHTLAQTKEDADGNWVHAYLHRVEGDVGNAGYWYRRAGKPIFVGEVAAEWEGIVRELLK